MRVGCSCLEYLKSCTEDMAVLDVLATESDWDKIFSVNAKGTFLCYKYAGRQMIAQGRGGRIIGACSVSGKRGKVLRRPKEPLIDFYCYTRFCKLGGILWVEVRS